MTANDDLRQEAASILQMAPPYSELELDTLRQVIDSIPALWVQVLDAPTVLSFVPQDTNAEQILVLPDGETFAGLGGCRVYEVPNGLEIDEIEEALEDGTAKCTAELREES